MTRPSRMRVAPKALIVRDGHLLLVECRDGEGLWYMPPGGGQHPGETLVEALRRECLEEIGADVEVGDIVLARDYVIANHGLSDRHNPEEHQVEIFFACDLVPGAVPSVGSEPDGMQTGVAWLALDELDRHRVYPRAIAEAVRHGLPTGAARYLGDVN